MVYYTIETLLYTTPLRFNNDIPPSLGLLGAEGKGWGRVASSLSRFTLRTSVLWTARVSDSARYGATFNLEKNVSRIGTAFSFYRAMPRRGIAKIRAE